MKTKMLLTIVTEASLEHRLSSDLTAHGALGWTVVEARGHGAHGHTDNDMLGGGNIRMEVIASPELVDKLVTHLRDVYFEHWHMIVFTHAVDVVRSEKFGT